MKKKLKVFCSLLMVVQMILSLAVMPAYAEEAAGGTGEKTEYAQVTSPSVVYNLNVDWKYKRAADSATFPLATALGGVVDANGKQFYEVDYDDSDWETVSVPHAVNAEDSFDGLGLDAGEAGLYRGFMFYRKHITVPETDAGKKFIIEFEAFRQSVYVYVNGTMAGYYEAGVAPVGFDLTDYIVAGQENVIAVATDNAASRGASFNTQETIPGTEPGSLTGYGYQWNTKDFNEVQGGLTGNVKLHAKNKIYQTLPLYSNMKTTGNYIYASNFDLRESSADITVEAEVRNEEAADKDITLVVDIVDNDGVVVGTFESEPTTVAAATDTADDQFLTVVPDDAYENPEVEKNDVYFDTVEVTKVTATANVADLKFWSDVSPNLYTVYTYLKDGDTIIDAQSTVTGFREVIHDKDKGLLINGESTYLKGYAQRSTNEWAAIGVANDWLSDIDMQLVKESNANYIRWMHIAPNPVDIRAGDKYGVVSVVPAGDKEGDVTGRAWDQRLESMRDVIIYFRNSPSVIFWEAGNEAITPEHMKRMTDLRKELDPSGYRFMGSRTISSQAQVLEAEWVGTMLYRHGTSAYASMQALGKYMPILETEYHRNEAPRRVWDDYSPPYYDYVNKWLGSSGSKTDGFDVWDQTQEDFSRTMFNSGDGYSYYYNNRVGGSGKNEYVGAAMMVWSDSNMHVRNCGVENARTSGRVDAARIKKESFYAIKAAQSATPEIHILGHWNYPSYIEGDMENGNYWYEDKTFNGQWWVPNGTMLQRNPTNKTVYVIGSEGLSRVELYVNDTLVGTDSTPTDNFIYAFEGVDVTQSGKVSAKAYNEREEVIAEHEIKTAGEAATIRLTPVTGPDGLRADGSDYLYVDVEVVDAEGNVCPLDDRKISFSVNDETKAKFIGGYNSGYYGDGLDGAGERIVNHKDYVFAENGINRVFVQSTREAGDFTLTATAEGMQPVTISLSSVEFATEGGLTTVPQQAYAQGEVPEPPKEEAAPVLKSLGETFVADSNWNEEGSNVFLEDPDKKDYYTVTLNGKEVEFAAAKRNAYKPDSSTGIVGEINTILDALVAAGANVTYTYAKDDTEGAVIPEEFTGEGGEFPLLTVVSGDNVTYAANGSTVVIRNGEKNLTNFDIVANDDGSALVLELNSVLGGIEGVTFTTDETNKTFDIVLDIPIDIAYANGAVTVTAGIDGLENANLILAGYDENGALVKTTITPVTLAAGAQSDAIAVDADILAAASAKAMLWAADMSKAMPLCDTVVIDDSNEAEVQMASFEMFAITPGTTDAVYQYDTVEVNNTCDTAITNGVVSTDTSPDGTAYLTAEGGDICLPGLSSDSTADIMWEADVRFNNEGSSIIPRNKAHNYGTCVIRNDGDGVPKLSIQTGGSAFTRYVEIDPTAWYKIVLIGRYSAPDARTDMIVYKYEADGTKTHVGTYEGVNQRNLSANNKSGANHWEAGGGISVDNAKITFLGVDALNVTSDADTITAGNTMGFDYGATRQGEYITAPEVTWEIYNADNTAPLSDENITITQTGILSVGLGAAAQSINVRVTAASGISASKAITVNAVDISNVKFDALTLSTEDEYVSATEPMTITVSATLNGEPVTLEDSDLIWYATDATDMQKLGDDLKWIKIENGVVTVDEKAVAQNITVRAADPEDKVRGSIPVRIKSSNALEGEEDGTVDRLLTSDNCEAVDVNSAFTDSIDGTHAYQVTTSHKTGTIGDTSGDVVIELDAKFTTEGVGWHITNSNNKVTAQVVYHNGNLCVQKDSSNYSTLTAIDPTKWYHIKAIRKMSTYFHVLVYEYDENGERNFVGMYLDQPQRNDSSMSAINVFSGLVYDNLRVLTPTPTDITIDTDVETVFAGNTVQATSELTWNGAIMRNPDASMFEYRIYDANDQYPIEGELITVDATGLVTVDAMAEAQDFYVRAVAKQSGKYASKKISVSSSDILTINKLGVDMNTEDKLLTLYVTKNFFYDKEMAFVTEIFDENGVLQATHIKSMYGDALKIGENSVSLNIELPEGFDRTTDTIKVYPVTRFETDDVTTPDGTLTVTKNADSVTVDALPTYDAASEVAILVLKADADETNVKAEDVLYFEMTEGIEAGTTFKWAQSYDGDYIVKTAGRINGIQTVTADGAAPEVTE